MRLDLTQVEGHQVHPDDPGEPAFIKYAFASGFFLSVIF